MSSGAVRAKFPIGECRKMLNKNGKKYTDEELEMIRDWMIKIAEITAEFIEFEERSKTKSLQI